MMTKLMLTRPIIGSLLRQTRPFSNKFFFVKEVSIGYQIQSPQISRFLTNVAQNKGNVEHVTEETTTSRSLDVPKYDRNYYWVEPEAEALIARAYARHKSLADTGSSFPPALAVKDLEAVGKAQHFKPETFSDRLALNIVYLLENFMHLFFREKYDHHAVTLETVAAVPGIVAAAHRHLRSLRRMKRDHGWINSLQEEAENERMHLLIWLQHTKPNAVERFFVMFAQLSYVTFYSALYAVSPKTAHRTTGYLEEAAHRAYTDFLQAVDNGEIENVPAMKIAKNYYHLGEDARLRDVILHVRGDESMHRDYNHHLANLYKTNSQDKEPQKMRISEELKENK